MTHIADEIAPGAWMNVVSQVLPLRFQAPPPFTLGEAMHELGLWATTARSESWKQRGSSLRDDALFQLTQAGPRVRTLVEDVVTRAVTSERLKIGDAVSSFARAWSGRDTVIAGFRDLCECAAHGDATTADLRPLADIVASQLGERARDSSGPLQRAANLLGLDPDPLLGLSRLRFFDRDFEGADPAVRLQAAEDRLKTESLTGHVVVWLLYERAVSPFRLVAGPLTFMRADWTVPNAARDDGQLFPERDELRALIEEVHWLQRLRGALEKTPKRYVLVRVDLGQRSMLRASDDAQRLVEAILAFGVIYGGTSWLAEGSSVVVLDGTPMIESDSDGRTRGVLEEDPYGMGVTSEILEELVGSIGEALASRPLSEELIEAAGVLREASLTDHRDVIFHGERAVTPRVATALEDHALELIASAAQMPSRALSDEFQIVEARDRFTQHLLALLTAPCDDVRVRMGRREEATELERLCTYYRNDVRVVLVGKVVEYAARIAQLPMSELARRDFQAGIVLATDASAERRVRDRVGEQAGIVAGRMRRVRNAVTHGNPLSDSALASVRAVSERTARDALQLALRAYAEDELVTSLIVRAERSRSDDERDLAAGVNYVARHPDC